MIKNKDSRELWLKKTLGELPNKSRILDAGAGELRYKEYCKHLNYVSQDFGQYDGSGDSRGLQTKKWDNSKLDIVSDIINIPEKDKSFDAIMCIEVFEHLPDPIKAVKEFSRLLKKEGKLILTAPVCSLTHFAPHYYYNGFSRYFYEKTLRENGFKILELKQNGNWFSYLYQELNRVHYMIDEYSEVKGFKGRVIKKLFSLNKKLFLKPIFHFLNKKDKGSEELISFGIQVVAEKK